MHEGLVVALTVSHQQITVRKEKIGRFVAASMWNRLGTV
jgi:hypothetical protein